MDTRTDMEEAARNLVAENARLHTQLDDWKVSLANLHAENARLTTDAAAECGRLRAELQEMTWRRDALLEAAQAVLNFTGSAFSEQEVKKRAARERAQETLRAAVAACAPEVEP